MTTTETLYPAARCARCRAALPAVVVWHNRTVRTGPRSRVTGGPAHIIEARGRLRAPYRWRVCASCVEPAARALRTLHAITVDPCRRFGAVVQLARPVTGSRKIARVGLYLGDPA